VGLFFGIILKERLLLFFCSTDYLYLFEFVKEEH